MDFINKSTCDKYRDKKLMLQLFDKIFYKISVLFVFGFVYKVRLEMLISLVCANICNLSSTYKCNFLGADNKQ